MLIYLLWCGRWWSCCSAEERTLTLLTRRTGEPSTGQPTWVTSTSDAPYILLYICTGFISFFPPLSFVSGHLEVVKLLVASGAEVDCKDKKAYTPLHAAASSGMSSTVHYLLGLGVHVSTDRHTHALAVSIQMCFIGHDVATLTVQASLDDIEMVLQKLYINTVPFFPYSG